MILRTRIRLSRPAGLSKTGILKYIKNTLKKGILTQGIFVERFERAIADFIGTKYAIAVSSGTAALHIALLACGIKDKDKVIAPDFTFPATVNAIELVGAEAVLMDIRPFSFNMDACLLEDFLRSAHNKNGVKAVIPVHQFGLPADMDPVRFIAKKYNLIVIEDAACAFGAEYRGKKAGSIGDAGIFSFHPRKIITTGEGGAIVTNNKRIAQNCLRLRNHGIANLRNRRAFTGIGFNYRLPELSASLGYFQMKEIKKNIRKRIMLAGLYKDKLKDISGLVCPSESTNSRHIFQTYAILLKKKKDRDRLKEFLDKNGIESGIYDCIIHRLAYYKKKYGLNDNRFKNTIFVSKRILTLPLYPGLEKGHIEVITNKIKGYFYGNQG